jgi:ubiquinone/menaquinone biosynthesis C-methylase UbiE
MLKPCVQEGMRVLDVGAGMGFFSLPMARMVGPLGRVICVDLQEKMLAGLRRRAEKAELSSRIETRKAEKHSLKIHDLADTIDFSLAFAVVHEIPDKDRFFGEILAALKPKAAMFCAEPSGHVSRSAFDRSLQCAEQLGFVIVSRPFVHLSHAAVLTRG